MNYPLFLRIWHQNRVLLDLTIDKDGYFSSVSKPEFPRNEMDLPDLEIDPWARMIRVQRQDVEFFGVERPEEE